MVLFRIFGSLFSRLMSLLGNSDYKGIRPGKILRGVYDEINKLRKKQNDGYIIPDEYVVFLGSDDFYIVKMNETEYTGELIRYLMEYSATRRYSPPGNVSIYYELDEDFSRGEYAVIGSYREGGKEDKRLESNAFNKNSGHKKTEASTTEYNISKSVSRGKHIRQGNPRINNDEDTIVAGKERIITARLSIFDDNNQGKAFNISSDHVTIGRSRTCNIRLTDSTVSRIHAYIKLSGEGYTIIDFNSNNGTYVNDSKVTEKRLVSGDIIRFGRVTMEFEVIS